MGLQLQPGSTEVRLLLAILAQVEALAELPDDAEEWAVGGVPALDPRGIPYEPNEWFSRPLTAAQRKAFSRANQRLADAGLIRRTVEPRRDRVTHLTLTSEGLKRSLELAGDQADHRAVSEGLQRTAWGRALFDDRPSASTGDPSQPSTSRSSLSRCLPQFLPLSSA
jgi:hypothetical protein